MRPSLQLVFLVIITIMQGIASIKRRKSAWFRVIARRELGFDAEEYQKVQKVEVKPLGFLQIRQGEVAGVTIG